MRNGKKVLKKKVPENFIETHSIGTRFNGEYTQMCARDINDALKEYRVADTFCILAITNIDLYPSEEWNFVFGLADMDS